MIRNIRWLVYSVALVLTLLPTIAAYYAVENIVQSAVQLGFNQNISAELDHSGQRLKELAKLNPAKEATYRKEFLQLQDLRGAYETLFRSGSVLKEAYLQTFLLISGLALFSAFLLAWWLNRRIIGSHDAALTQMRKAKERTLFLEQNESWRLFAQKLVHEIKNPLTPVQVMVGRIPKKYALLHPNPSLEFTTLVEETRAIVDEEILKVNQWIEAFSQYARMPAPKYVSIDPRQMLELFVQQYKDQWPMLQMSFVDHASQNIPLRCDPSLVKQVLFNLAKNTAEIETRGPLQFRLELLSFDNQSYGIRVSDDGPGISAAIAKRLFQPYTTEKGERGMGLGLAIAKKVLLEHGGEIEYVASEKGCTFLLTFPPSATKEIHDPISH